MNKKCQTNEMNKQKINVKMTFKMTVHLPTDVKRNKSV